MIPYKKNVMNVRMLKRERINKVVRTNLRNTNKKCGMTTEKKPLS